MNGGRLTTVKGNVSLHAILECTRTVVKRRNKQKPTTTPLINTPPTPPVVHRSPNLDIGRRAHAGDLQPNSPARTGRESNGRAMAR